jgi:hypothetical protein
MPDDNGFLKGAAIAAPLGFGASFALKGMAQKGYFNMPQVPSSSAFLGNLRAANLQSNQGARIWDFFGANQLLFKKEPEIARTAWIQAVQSTDPMAEEVLSFGGDLRAASPGKVVSSIEQTLQRNNSVFMARIFNKFRSNVSALRKHYEVTRKMPQFKAVEGLRFPAPRGMAINDLPAEIAAFHKRITKDTGITGTGTGMVKYYSRPGWEGYGTYVMSFKRGKMPFDITVPVARGGMLMEGLTQSARRIATGVGVLDPMSGAIERLKTHEFYMRDIERSILPRMGEYRSGWEIEKAISQAYERSFALETIPNLPEGRLSEAWKNYARIKGQAFRVVTEGKVAQLKPGELYRSVFGGLTEEQFKDVLGRSDIYPFPGPKNLAKNMVSSFNAAEWFMTQPDVEWAGQPRQLLRQWRASEKAVAEMMASGSAKWSIFETQAWKGFLGPHGAPWVPTIYVDPVKHGAILERLGLKEGEMLLADTPSFRRQFEVTGQPFPIHLASVEKGVAERIKRGATGLMAFSEGELLGMTPAGESIAYRKGMELLGLEPFKTVGRGEEFTLMYRQTLRPETAGKYFGIKAVQKFKDPWEIEKAVAEMTKGLPAAERYQFTKLEGKVRLATTDALKHQHYKNRQLITGLWKAMSEMNIRRKYKSSSKAAAFLTDPTGFIGAMRGKYGTAAEFTKALEQFAVIEGGLPKGRFYSVFGGGVSGLSIGISQAIFHDPMRLTGAGVLGSVEPRMFDVLRGGQYGSLGEAMSAELASRLAVTNPQRLATYEGLTKTLASYAGKLTPGKTDALWDITTKGYTHEGFQKFIEGGGGFMKMGARDIFVPGGDVLTPFMTPAGKYIPGDLAMEYHRLARGMAQLHTQAKRVGLEEADELVRGFIRNVGAQQAPYGSGAGAIAGGKVLGSRFLRGVSEFAGKRAPGAMTVGIPEYIGYQMFGELENLPGMNVAEVEEIATRLRAGKSVGGMIWRHPLAGPYSAQPINIQMMKGVTEPVVLMPSQMIDVGLKNPIELSPMVGMGMDLDADIASVSLVSPDLEKKIRKGWTYADNQYTQAYMEHMVRAQIIKTKAAGGAGALAASERKVADALKLAIGQQWIGKLSLQFSATRQAAVQRLGGQQAANAAFLLNWLEESVLKAKHLPGEQVLGGSFSALLGTVESAFKTRDPERLERVVQGMLEKDDLSRQLLEQEVRIPKNIEAVRRATGVRSMKNVLPALNLRETTRDIMSATESAESTGLEEMSRAAAGRRPITPRILEKYLAFTGSVLSGSKGVFAGVSSAAVRGKNFMASMGMGVLEHKKALGWGFLGSIAIAAALSKPQDLVGTGAEFVPGAKGLSQGNRAAARMSPEDVLPPEQPLGEPTAPTITSIPSVRILPGAERRNINISARSRSRLNTEDMVQRYQRRVNSDKIHVNVRDNRSRLSSHEMADRMLR